SPIHQCPGGGRSGQSQSLLSLQGRGFMDLTKSGMLTEAETTEGQASDAPAESPAVTRLVELAKSGDPEAFAGLMRLYERRVIGLGVQMGLSQDDAMDACQDAFVKVFRYIGRFQSGRAFFKWLYR